MKIPDPDNKAGVVTTAKEQPLSTTTPQCQKTTTQPLIVKREPLKMLTTPQSPVKDRETEDDVQSIIDDVYGRVPEGLICIPLIRFSSPRQSDGYSEERQEQVILETVEQFKWILDDDIRIEDLGVSGFRINPRTGRPYNMDADAALGAFMIAVEKGTLNVRGKVCAVEDVTRFGRACIDTADSAFWALVRKGLSFYFIANRLFIGPKDRNNLIKRIILLLEFEKANKTVEEMSRRITKTLILKLSLANRRQKVNWGAWMPAWIKFVEKPEPHYEWVPEKHAILQRIISEVLKGRSLNAIATDLNTEKVPCWDWGKRWHAASIAGTIQREILKGTFTFRGVRIENYYPAAVSPEVWAQLQTRVRFPRKPGGGTTKGKRIQSIFPAIVTCAHCGRTMHAQPYNGPDAPFSQRVYTCRSQEDGGAGENGHTCQGGQRIYIDAIERDFFAMVLSQNPTDFQSQKDDGRQAELDAALTELAEVSAKIRCIMKLADKYADTEEADKELEPLYGKKRDLQTKIKTLEQRAARGIETAWLNVVKAFVGTLSLDQINDAQLRALLSAGESLHSQLWNQEVRFSLIGPLRTLVSRIEVDASGQRYRIHFLGGTVGEWRDVSGGVDSIRKLHAQFNNTEEIKKLRSEGRKRWWAETGGHSAETIAKAGLKRAETLKRKTYAERLATRQRQSAAAKAWRARLTPEQNRDLRERQVKAKLSRGPEQVRQWAEKMNKKAAETRANRTPEQRQEISARTSASKREYYANMSPEEKAALSAKRKAAYAATQARMSPEQREALKAKIVAGQRAFYAKLPPEERAAAFARRCDAARETYRAMSPEQRAARKAERRSAATEAYAKLNPEEKAIFHARQAERNAAQAAAWAKMTPEEKAAFNAQRRATRTANLAKMDPEMRATAIANRSKGNAVAIAKINAMSPEERAVHNAKVRAGLEAAFAKMTPEEKAALYARRRAAQAAAFRALSPEVKAAHQAKRRAAQDAYYEKMRAKRAAPSADLEAAQVAV